MSGLEVRKRRMETAKLWQLNRLEELVRRTKIWIQQQFPSQLFSSGKFWQIKWQQLNKSATTTISGPEIKTGTLQMSSEEICRSWNRKQHWLFFGTAGNARAFVQNITSLLTLSGFYSSPEKLSTLVKISLWRWNRTLRIGCQLFLFLECFPQSPAHSVSCVA